MPKPDSTAALFSSLEERGAFQIKPGLERVSALLETLGRPQDRVPTIHIAGTNGKGSVAAALESVLRLSGYRTGLYTSPHLVEWLERYQIDAKPVDEERFLKAAHSVLDSETASGVTLTHFEFLTVTAFVLFADASIDVLVLETGMGGRWDATNVVDKPVLALITSIGLDHMEWLGSNEAQIAGEKAGIIKAQVPVISGVRGSGQAMIAMHARAARSPMRQIDQDFYAKHLETDWGRSQQRVKYHSAHHERTVSFGLLGPHQVDNVAVALAGLDELRALGWTISEDAIREGLEKTTWPGRFQVIAREGGAPVILDGAHNPHAMRQFLDTLGQSTFKNTPKTFLFSTYKDKNYRQLASMISPAASVVVVTGLHGSRRLSPSDLRDAFADRPTTVHESPTPEEAWELLDSMTPADEVIVVTGSLALVGSVLAILKKKESLCLKS